MNLMRELVIFDRFRSIVMPDRKDWFPVTTDELKVLRGWPGWQEVKPEECDQAKDLRKAICEWAREREQCDVNLYYAREKDKALAEIIRLCGKDMDAPCLGCPKEIEEIAVQCVKELLASCKKEEN